MTGQEERVDAEADAARWEAEIAAARQATNTEDELAAYAASLEAGAPVPFSLGKALPLAILTWLKTASLGLVAVAIFYLPLYFLFKANDLTEAFAIMQKGWGSWPGQVYQVVAQSVLVAMLSYATFQSLGGHRGFALAAIGKGLRRAGPVFGVMFVLGVVSVGLLFGGALLATSLGINSWLALLLLVPPLIVAGMWCVAIPAAAVEPIGVLDAIRRSNYLTKGHRVGIVLLLVFLLFDKAGIENLMRRFLIGDLTGTKFLAMTTDEKVGAVNLLLAIDIGISGLAASFFAVAASVIYYMLRQSKEGTEAADIIAVFR